MLTLSPTVFKFMFCFLFQIVGFGVCCIVSLAKNEESPHYSTRRKQEGESRVLLFLLSFIFSIVEVELLAFNKDILRLILQVSLCVMC